MLRQFRILVLCGLIGAFLLVMLGIFLFVEDSYYQSLAICLVMVGLSTAVSVLLTAVTRRWHLIQQGRMQAILQAIRDERLKESKHEYYQEQMLMRLEEHVSSVVVLLESRLNESSKYRENIDVLFITSNGAGLGHLTRALAIANAVEDKANKAILTLSRAYEQIREQDVRIYYFPSADTTGDNPKYWNPRFRKYLAQFVARFNPRLILFDGAVVYDGVTAVARGFDIPLIWVQRGCWKADVDLHSKQRHHAITVSDAVLVPGDLACVESVDAGPDIRVYGVGPIVLTRQEDLLTREDACKELGLDPSRQHVLVTFGGSSFGDSQGYVSQIYEAITQLGNQWDLSVLRSPLADKNDIPGQVHVYERYPVAPVLHAFDIVVSAAGYNSVQEAGVLGIPTVLVPNVNTITDDQERRARGAVAGGWALSAGSASEAASTVSWLAQNPDEIHNLRSATRKLPNIDGAHQAADLILRYLETKKQGLGSNSLLHRSEESRFNSVSESER